MAFFFAKEIDYAEGPKTTAKWQGAEWTSPFDMVTPKGER
jgi:hypothetical protein